MVELVLEEAKEKMEKSIDAFSNELVNIRTGRANPSMLDRVMVEYYGSPTPLNQVAGISVVEGNSPTRSRHGASSRCRTASMASSRHTPPTPSSSTTTVRCAPGGSERRVPEIGGIGNHA